MIRKQWRTYPLLSTGGGWGCIQVRGSSDSAFRLWPCIAPNMVILGLCWLVRLGSAGGLNKEY